MVEDDKDLLTPEEHYHQFGQHPPDRDPWDALLLDITALDDSGEYKALVTFWATEAKKRAVVPKVAEERDKLLATLIVALDRLGGRVTFTHDELNDANEYRALQVVDDNGVTLTLRSVRIKGAPLTN